MDNCEKKEEGAAFLFLLPENEKYGKMNKESQMFESYNQ